MRILIDTNIIIYREDNSELNKELSELFNVLNENNVQVLVHPASKKDLHNDPNKERRKIIFSKLSTYPQLESPPKPDSDDNFRKIIPRSHNTNDEIDAQLLYAVYRDAVSFFITNDNKLIDKSTKLNISDRVFSLNEASFYFKKYFKKIDIETAPPAIKKIPLHNIDITESFFDSLKEDYDGFDKWFQKKSGEGKKAWVYYDKDGSIGAFLMLKEELESISNATPTLPNKKRVKISTLKVTTSGLKIGELFIKIAIEYAIKRKIDEIYLTHYDKENDALLPLIHNYGFYHLATKNDAEKVYVKELVPLDNDVNPEDVHKYYPSYYDGQECRKFIIPIKQHYHNLLFQDCKFSDSSLFHLSELVIEGNAIKKAYLSHSKTKKIRKSDIVLFYLSKTYKLITALGVVDDVFYDVKDSDEIIKKIGKRSVYDKTDVEELSKKNTLIILFKWHFYFNNEISYSFLIKEGIINGPPQSIIEIEHNSYLKIKDKGGIDYDFTFD